MRPEKPRFFGTRGAGTAPLNAYKTAAILLLAALLSGCSQGYSQGDCDPGYLKVKGECVLAVGPECERNRDCLTDICLVDPETSTQFCSIQCLVQEACPTGFFCTTWADRRCYPGQRPPPCQQDDECDPCQTCVDGNCQIKPDCFICTGDGDCGGCERCVDYECIPVAGCQPCSQDAECATCEICSDRMQCERLPGCQLCATDNECPGCTRCDRGACIPIAGCGSDPCFNDLDCPSRTACLLDASSGLMVCLPVGLDFGQDCSRGGAPTCSGGVCLVDPASLEATCSQTCELDEECPVGTVCEPDGDCLWACRPPAGTPPGAACGSNADCPELRLCGLVADEQAGLWEARCMDPLACAAAAGEPCGPETSGRCASGICAEFELCSAVCAAHGGCPPEGLCVQLSLALPEQGPNAAFWGCAPRDQALFEVGQPCPGGDQDCREGLCALAGTTGPTPRCTRTCTPGEADCPDGFTCLADPLDPQRQICLPAVAPGACAEDLDCPQDEVCSLAVATGLPTCDPGQNGGAGAGQACALDSDCIHGACSEAGVCTTPCALDGDCPEGLVCDTRRWPRADGQVSWVRRCALPPGSLAPCRSRSDCQAGEVCRPELSWRLTGLEGRCGPAGSGAGEGEACQAGSGCESGACTALQACTRLCALDGDCQDDQRVCAPMELSGPAGQAWTSHACRPAPVGLGEPCPTGDDDCSSGVCHLPAEGEAYCTLTCIAHEDCAEVEGMTCVADASGTTCRLP